jgi:hypothetical protein
MHVFALLIIYAIDFYCFFSLLLVLLTLCTLCICGSCQLTCLLMCFPTETVSNYKTLQSWKMTLEITCFLFLFSLWLFGTWQTGTYFGKLYTNSNSSAFVTSVQISQTIHLLKLHVLCAKYLETLRFDMIPNRIISTIFHLTTDELKTLCWLLTSDELKPSGWLTLFCFCNAQDL